jgi:broad specificity phosphatase PhoE
MRLRLRANYPAPGRLMLTAVLLAGSSAARAQTPPAPPTQQQQPQQPTAPAAKPANGTATGPSQADLDLIKQLRGGGLAIVMRHAPADPDKADTRPLEFKNLKTQQPLTDAGRSASRAVGDALRAINVPISEVLTSRFNRAYQTAVLAGFPNAKPVIELTEGSLVTSPNEQRRRASALKQLLAAPLAPRANRLLVTHRINMMQAFGKEWFEVKEGEASIFRVDNGAYTLVARVQLSDWARLAQIVER